MPGCQPGFSVEVTPCQRQLLKQLLRHRQLSQGLVWRIRIILLLAKGFAIATIARWTGKSRHTVRLWGKRWLEVWPQLQVAQAEEATKGQLKQLLQSLLSDAPRCGAPGKFTAEQQVAISALACETPEQYGRPVTHWTPRELAQEVVQQGITTAISVRTVSRLLVEADLKPHHSRYWLKPLLQDPDLFEAQSGAICDLYAQASRLHQQGIHLVSTDEKTGIQALERKHPPLPMCPGQIERQEFEYLRHGTQCLMANFEVATGQILAPTVSDTRTEQDFASHIAQTVARHPKDDWIFIVDQLNTHQSETLVRWVAEVCSITVELGETGKSGILKRRATRQAFLETSNHRIRFVYTPKHASWLNQVELWFSILVRRLLKRASVTSVAHLKTRLLEFIDYFNRTFKSRSNGLMLANHYRSKPSSTDSPTNQTVDGCRLWAAAKYIRLQTVSVFMPR